MSPLLDAAWRALVYCLHPRVVVLSFLPLVLMLALAFVFGYWLWDPAVQALSQALQSAQLLQALLNWLSLLGLGDLRTAFAPLLLVVLITPVVVVLCLLLVSLFMTPAMVGLVAERRFPALLRLRGASWWSSLWWSLGATALAVLALVLTLPLWWVPPFVLVVPPPDLGLVDLPGVRVRCFGRPRHRRGAPRHFAAPPLAFVGHGRGDRLFGCRAQRVVGFG